MMVGGDVAAVIVVVNHYCWYWQAVLSLIAAVTIVTVVPLL